LLNSPTQHQELDMTTSSTPGAIKSAAVAIVVTAAILVAGTATRPAVALTSADSVDIAQGISITPAPGWTVGDRGPNWVALSNANSSAQMQVAVKPASGTDLVAMLQADINQLTSTPSAGLINVKSLSAPNTKMLQGANFQQEAFIDYTADVSTPQGPIPVIGTFSELLNTVSQQSAFIDFRQNDGASAQAVSDGGAMINSLI
jgi:hypothetical protein